MSQPPIDLASFFGTVDVQASQQRAKEFENLTGNGIRYFRLDKGVNRIAICPPWSKEGLIVRQIGSHYSPATKTGFPCPEVTTPGVYVCPVCYVYRLLAAAGRQRDDLKILRFNTRSLVNCIPLMQGGKDVPLVKFAHVLEASYLFSDFLNKNVKDFPDLTNMSNALPISVEKKEENSRTSYSISWYPSRTPIIGTMEEAAGLAASLYNLDELAEGKWTRDAYDNAVKFANSSLKQFGMVEIPDFTGLVPPPTKEGRKKKDPGAPGQGSPEVPVAQPQVAPPPVFVPQVTSQVAPVTTPVAPVPAPSPETGMVRDGKNINEGTGLPFCLGWHSPEDKACSECASMGPCIVDSMNRM